MSKKNRGFEVTGQHHGMIRFENLSDGKYMVWLDDEPDITVRGDSIESAVGKLILNLGHRLDVVVINP